jgi:ribosomal protein L11 methyltransferase
MEPRYPTLHVRTTAGEVDDVSALLFDLGATGVEERDATTLEKPLAPGTVVVVAHFDGEDEARIAAAQVDAPSELVWIVGDAWRHEWRKHFRASRVGKSFVVHPPWESPELAPHEIPLCIDPGIAFGTGTHESTRLALAAMEGRVRPGARVLDVGCGSGILAIGALKLGAATAIGIDVEPEALVNAGENAERNGVADRFRTVTSSIESVWGLYDVVLANIESRVLVPFAPAIARRVKKGGVLVLAGLLRPEETEIRAAYSMLRVVSTSTENDWLSVVCERA